MIESLALLDGEESLRMVAAWHLVPRGLTRRAMIRAWARLANVAELRARRKAPGLLAEICRPDGSVLEDAGRLVGLSVLRAAGARQPGVRP